MNSKDKKKKLTLKNFKGSPTFKPTTSKVATHKRGFEIIFPYQEGVFKIKKEVNISPDQKKIELNKFKAQFEKNFQGIPLYKEAGCSNARLSEYLECLISTDGKDCKIYYTQMRIVD